MIAHVAGVPVEETVTLLAGTAGAGLLLVRGWLSARMRSLMQGTSASQRHRKEVS